ncbi:response regulator receiver domain-containing protein [Pontibacter mucosus]|uniref:Response regulator receiver domain-containing protein n=1 Tax=Pontibacter mucosus TaxID=1649266 RepID=A0A2T5YPJ2_9BACT|nr:response regulator transcription factor [Pontibacter mucosus]PTX21221.1 response regulator receiver domain-containing protein [Pontibacter mucosus]
MEYQPLTLAIADDHNLFRKGVLELLKAFDEITLVADASNGAELLEKIESDLPDVIMLDLEMPEMDGVATSRYLLSKYPDVRILVMSTYGDEALVESLLEEGVKGYLLKNSEPDELRQALQALKAGKGFFSSGIKIDMLN